MSACGRGSLFVTVPTYTHFKTASRRDKEYNTTSSNSSPSLSQSSRKKITQFIFY